MNQTPNVGHLIEGVAHRDAIHVAVAPVEAGQPLPVGARVDIIDGKAYLAGPDGGIGLVDPWLIKHGIHTVEKGQRFWLMMDQGKITSLRHVWTHEAFKAQPPGATDAAVTSLPSFERVMEHG